MSFRLKHFVITRFSYREKPQSGGELRGRKNPLDPDELDKRFLIFESTALRSVLAQTNREFTWVLIVDPELPQFYRDRLLALLSSHPNAHIVNYDPNVNLGSLTWLEPLFDKATCKHIVTTNVDDDDLFPANFFEVIRSNLFAAAEMGCLPGFRVLATKKYVQWDMSISEKAPLGWIAPWHRGKPRSGWRWGVWPTNVGLSLYCRYPDHEVSALGINHAVCELALNPEILDLAFRTPRLKAFREVLLNDGHNCTEVCCFNESEASRSWSVEKNFFDVGLETEAVVIVNHEANDSGRLFEKKPGRVPVAGPENFPGIDIDWGWIRTNSKRFMHTESSRKERSWRRLLANVLPGGRRNDGRQE